MSTLVFFDINGTLITRDERTDIPFSNAVNTLLNYEELLKHIKDDLVSNPDFARRLEVTNDDETRVANNR